MDGSHKRERVALEASLLQGANAHRFSVNSCLSGTCLSGTVALFYKTMQILLANAKIMRPSFAVAPISEPRFQNEANLLASEMASLNVDDLALQLDCSRKLAAENWQRFQYFFSTEPRAALLAYFGQAYKHLKAETLSPADLSFAQSHLWITSFLYGLLRPLDGIVPYRMEHTVKLETTGQKGIAAFWKERLTDFLIDSAKADDGCLLHLATEEYEHLFDWKRVRRELTVVQPIFYVEKAGRLKVQSVWAKSLRGAMARHVITHRLSNPALLASFAYEGFAYEPRLGEPAFPHFVRREAIL